MSDRKIPKLKNLISKQTTQGNIDLAKRKAYKNPDGSHSTIKSISVNFGGDEILIPTISPEGKRLTNQEAINLYRKTKQHLGTFSDPKSATEYAKKISQRQGQRIQTGVIRKEK